MAGLWRKREKGVWQSGPWAREMAVNSDQSKRTHSEGRDIAWRASGRRQSN